MARLLLLSNGHGEDLSGALLGQLSAGEVIKLGGIKARKGLRNP